MRAAEAAAGLDRRVVEQRRSARAVLYEYEYVASSCTRVTR